MELAKDLIWRVRRKGLMSKCECKAREGESPRAHPRESMAPRSENVLLSNPTAHPVPKTTREGSAHTSKAQSGDMKGAI